MSLGIPYNYVILYCFDENILLCLFIRLYPDMLPQQEDNSVTHKDWTDKEIQESINALSFYLTNMRTRVQSNVTLTIRK